MNVTVCDCLTLVDIFCVCKRSVCECHHVRGKVCLCINMSTDIGRIFHNRGKIEIAVQMNLCEKYFHLFWN